MLPAVVLSFAIDGANGYASVTPSVSQLIISILGMAALYENRIFGKAARNEVNRWCRIH